MFKNGRRYIVPAALVATAFLCAFHEPIRLDDLFLYLTFGRMAANGGIPALDPLIFTIKDHQWHPWHEWLSFNYFYSLYSLGGYPAIIALRSALAAAAAALIYFTGAKRGLGAFAATAIAVAAMLAAAPRIFRDRSSIFTDLFVLTLLAVLFSPRANKLKWFLPPLFALWVNLHSGFIFGWFFLGLFVLIRGRLQWLPVLLLCVAATVLNPHGIDGALWPVRAIFGNDWGILGRITEFGPVYSIHGPLYVAFFAALTLAAIVLSAYVRDGFAFFCALTAAALGWRYARMTGLAGLSCGIVLAAALPALKAEVLRADGLKACAASLVLLATALLALFLQPFEGWPLHRTVPVQAAEFLMSLPPGPVFNDWQAGGFLAWELNGRQRIAAHGFISDPALAERYIYRPTMTREGWQEVVLDGGVRYFFLRRQNFEESRDAAWIRELQGPGWKLRYSDPAAVIFERAF